MTDLDDAQRAAGVLLKTQGAAAARRICDTQIAAADRFGDLDGQSRWKSIRAAIDSLAAGTPEPGGG